MLVDLCMCMCVQKHACSHAFGSQMLKSDVFLYPFLPNFLKQYLLLIWLGSLGILLSMSHQCWAYRPVPGSAFSIGVGNLTSGSHVCTTSTFTDPIEPSPKLR